MMDAESKEILGRILVIVLAQQDTAAVLNRAFGLGASDVIPLGYDAYAMLRRVENLHKQHLETLVEEQKRVLHHSSDSMVDALSAIIEYRSVESGQHIQRIRYFTRVLLEEVARCCPEYRLTESLIDIICSASALHDIGKIAIPDGILMKPGRLAQEEREIMKTHTITGCRILESLKDVTHREYLRYAHNICHYHHERWDGGGYPECRKGEAIPICAQVVSLADVYDALTSKLLDCFKHVSHQFEALAAEYADGKLPEKEAIRTDLPLPEKQEEDAMERIRGKYYALVHYINGLLMELDMDRKLFHLVYNPYPELSSLQELDTLEEIEDTLCNRFVHLEDRENMEWFLHREINRFLDDGLRRASYRIRARSRQPEGTLFELTLLPLSSGEIGRQEELFLSYGQKRRRRIYPGGGIRDSVGRKESLSDFRPQYSGCGMLKQRNTV